MAPRMERQPEPEAMDRDDEARAYAVADFVDVNQAFVDRLLFVWELLRLWLTASCVDLSHVLRRFE